MSNSLSNALALEDRFEVLKEVGDGSFGSVAIARVRAAGSSVARRNTVVCSVFCCLRIGTDRCIDCYQNYEKDLRVFGTMSRTTGGCLPPNAPSSPTSGTSNGHFPGSILQEASHCHGVYGWESVPAHEVS